MPSFIIRALLLLSSVITGWFVATDSDNFNVFNMMVAVLLVTLGVAVTAYWPQIIAWFKGNQGGSDTGAE